MLTVEEQQCYSKIAMRLGRIADSLDSIAKNLDIISQLQMDKNLDMTDYFENVQANLQIND
jgi:hypothetical protein